MRRISLQMMFCLAGFFLAAAGSAQDYVRQWDPIDVSAQIDKACAIPPAYFRVEREFDGKAKLNQSPSVTREQSICARKILDQYEITVRN